MKIRSGFVSNSSSTSFTLFGVSFYGDRDARWALDEIIGDLKLDISTYNHPHSDRVYIGRSYTKMGMDETRRQFEEYTAKDMSNIFNTLKDQYESEDKESICRRYSFNLPEDIDEIINNPQKRCCEVSDGWYNG